MELASEKQKQIMMEIQKRDFEQDQAKRLEADIPGWTERAREAGKLARHGYKRGDIVSEYRNGQTVYFKYDGERMVQIPKPNRRKRRGEAKRLKVLHLNGGNKIYLHPTKGFRKDDGGSTLRPRHVKQIEAAIIGFS